MLLYNAGLSYEKAGSLAHASHEAVREWYQKGRELFEGSTEKREGIIPSNCFLRHIMHDGRTVFGICLNIADICLDPSIPGTLSVG